MAASVKNMVGASQDSSSSSDDEALKRCQEAVWDTRPANKEDSNQKSKRVVVAAHEHDGNELQVSQGFRTHVAKKLGHLLDSFISETHSESFCVESAKCEDANDEGFRLFSTSVPGKTTEEPPAPVRRRPVQSSSDSDSEMESRLREAAVSVKDLLPSLKLPSTQSPTSAEPEKQKKKKKKKVVEGEDGSIVKTKRRRDQEEDGQVDCTSSAHCEQEDSGQEQTQVKVKRKKKKKSEGNTMEGVSN